MANARERIEKLISENPVVLFMKGTPEFPQCGFSGQVIQILEYVGAPVVGVNVLEDAEIRQGVKEYANWPTIPQLYVKGEFVGGCDIVREMFQSGELSSVLTDAGALPLFSGAWQRATRGDKLRSARESRRPLDAKLSRHASLGKL
jgi:monothiol glutaredoxin